MASKSYLIVSRAFYPMNSPRANRTTELAKELCRQGHAVTVLTPAHPDQDSLIQEYGLKIIDLGQPSWPEVPLSAAGPMRLAQRALRRFLQIFFDYPTSELVFRIPRLMPRVEEHDVLISIAAPHAVHWGVARALRKGAKPAKVWLADCGDPFMGQENDSFSPAPYFKYVEKAFCRRADAIVVPIEEAREAYYPEFREKIHVIPQGFRFADYDHLKALAPEEGEVIRFAFAGLFIPGRRDPGKLLDVLTAADRKFEFHVFTRDPGLVRPYADRDPRIRIREFIPRGQLLEELATMDFVVNIENAGPRQSPSKLIDYWLSGRPIMNVKTGDVPAELVEDFLDRRYERALKLDRPEKFDIESVAKSFDRLADQLIRAESATAQLAS